MTQQGRGGPRRNILSLATVAAVVASVAIGAGSVTLGIGPSAAAPLPAAMVSLSFDDGWSTQFTNARSELRARGFVGTFFTITRELQTPSGCCMTLAQTQTLKNEGDEIASHTITHTDLTTLSPTALLSELHDSKTYLESTFGSPVTSFTSPYGAFNASVLAAIRGEYRVHRTISPGLINTDSYVDQLPSYDIHQGISVASVKATIDRAIAQKNWAILTFHEIVASGASTGTQLNRADFVAILDYIRSTGISVVTVANGASQLAGRISPVESGTTIYDDGLRNGFADWSWATHDLSQSAVVQSGATAVSFEPDGYSGLLFHTPPLPAANYDALEFWVNGGVGGGQNVNIAWRNGSLLGQVALGQAAGGTVVAGAWRKVSIPLAAMGISPAALLSDLYFEDVSGANQPTLYLDDIRLTPAGSTTTTTTSTTTTTTTTTSTTPVTTVPPSGTSVALYDDSLQNAYQNWSWAVSDFGATSPVHSGSRSIRFEPDQYGALYLHSDAGIDTSAYSAVRFWVFPTAGGGQRLAVVALDGATERGRVAVDSAFGGPLVGGVWQEVTVSLSSLNATSGPLKDIYIQDMSGSDQPAVFVDDVRLTGPGGGTTTTTTPTTTTTVPAPTTTVPAQLTQIVFDEALRSGWRESGSTASVNFSATPAHGGTRAVSLRPGVSSALSLVPGTALQASSVSSILFWVNGGSAGSQPLFVRLQVGSVANQVSVAQILGHSIRANTWEQVSIPMSRFGTTGSVTSITFGATSTSKSPTLLLDDIAFVLR